MAYNEDLEDRIDHYFITNEKLVKNKRLGWVGWLIDGNMCFGIYSDLLIVRLNDNMANTLVKKQGVNRFQQAQDTAGTILSISSRIYSHNEALIKFLEGGIEYTKTLPARETDQWTNKLD
ncbi:MAG: hypothetical protein U5K69_19610 [Balneolaceae bacterium]|nr:hypothetical protein [Balneolaceae bacterium]